VYGIEATGQTSSAKVSYHIRLATPVLFPISLSSVYTDVILSNRNAEQSHIPVTRAFIPAKPAPQLRNSDGSITLKYPENDLFGFSVAPLLFVGITMIVSASQFCAYSAKMTNTFWHRSGFLKAFVMLLLVAQTALFVPEVRDVASERAVLPQVPQAVATQATLFCPTSTSAASGCKLTLQFPMGRNGDGFMACCEMMRSSFSEMFLKFVNFACVGSNFGFPPSFRLIPDRFDNIFCINALVHTINSGFLCAQHLDHSDRPETAWTLPMMFVAVFHNGIIFQEPVACVPPYVFISPSVMCIMGSTSTVILTISPSDCMAGKTDAPLAMTFFPVTSAILSGGTSITMHPTNFFASSVAHVVSAGASSVPGLNIARGAASSTAVVLATSGATINASAAVFIIKKPASRSNVAFLTGISLSLLAAGFCAHFISLPRLALHLSAMVYLTVCAPFSA